VPPPPAPPAPGAPLLENPGNVPLVQGNADLTDVTVRQLVRVSVTGSQIRLRFSNEASGDVLPLGAVHVARAGADGRIVAGSDHAVTFDGKASVVIPASSPLLSDPVAMPVKALDRLLISVHLPGVAPRSGHALFMYVSTPGNHTAAAALPGVRLARITALVSEVDVDADAPGGVIATLGDSITEGAASTANAFRGWPDRLAERLAGANKGWGVVNAGISGNRILRYGTGPSALARLDRDVLSIPGLKAIILLEGINDIGNSFNPTAPRDPVTAESLIAADKQIIARAHAKGVKVYGGLLTPYQGAGYASPAGEQVRQALNDWIRTGGAFDGVIDFATPTADPANPLTFAAQYNERDKLHPNDAGYQAMANAIDLDMITK
jgi:lysophospholipase L1-like esterase